MKSSDEQMYETDTAAPGSDAAERTQVLVVGGALSGLSEAMFLAARGVDVLLVERHRDLLNHPRLRGITPRTVELYREQGLEPRILERGFAPGPAGAGDGGKGGGTDDADSAAPFVPVRAETLAGEFDPVEEVAQGEFVDPSRYSPCTYGSIDQDQLEGLLRDRAVELGARMHFGTELISFEQDASGVNARLRPRDDAAGEEGQTDGQHDWTARADYLIAADGVQSPVRQALGIESDGPGVLFHTITALVNADLSAVLRGRRLGIAYLQKPRPFSTMMPHDAEGTRWVFSTGIDPDREALADFTDDRVAAMVREAAGMPDADVTLRPQIPGTDLTVLGFPIGAQVARQYGSGRAFLVGDAARIQPPTGGFGGSTGVQDAHNLAWKLAAVLHGWAGPGLLDSYQEERQPYGGLAMRQALARFGDRMAGGPEEEVLDHAAVTMGYRYASAVIADDSTAPVHPLDLDGTPGTRAPHRTLPDGRSTLDLFGDGFVLVLSEPESEEPESKGAARQSAVGDAWQDAAEKCRAELGVPLAVRRVPAEVAAAYGIGTSGASLVRPDGFVAWRAADAQPSGPTDATETLAAALRTAAALRSAVALRSEVAR